MGWRNSFSLELIPMIAAILSFAVSCPLTIVSDSESAIKVATRLQMSHQGSERVRQRQKCRPLVNCLRLLICARRPHSTLQFVHVRSHTGAADRLSLGNSKADELAKWFRLHGPRQQNPLWWRQFDEPFVAIIDNETVTDDLRSSLLASQSQNSYSSWKRLPVQGIVLRQLGSLSPAIRLIRDSNDDRFMVAACNTMSQTMCERLLPSVLKFDMLRRSSSRDEVRQYMAKESSLGLQGMPN
jgi:hypothetical protein